MNLTRRLAKCAYRSFQTPKMIFELCNELVKRQRCSAEAGSKLHSSSRIFNQQGDRTKITIGRGSQIYGDLLIMRHGGRISIGKYSFVSEGTRIWSGKNIYIGDRVLISHDVNIHDTSSHSISAQERHEHFLGIVHDGHPKVLRGVEDERIIIEDDAWIGFGSAILKGVTIGRGAIIGACSIVTKDIPAYTIVAGNPALKIGEARP
jgi:acetyltransferase-like isoleucine patch superfamily enzyme